MAVFPDKIVLKNSTDGDAAIRAAIAPGGTNPIVPGELVVAMDTNGASLYTLNSSNAVVQLIGGGANGVSGVTSVNGLGGYVDLPGSGLSDIRYNGDEDYEWATIVIPGFGKENEVTTESWGVETPDLTPRGDLKCVLSPVNRYGTSTYCNNAALQINTSTNTNFRALNFTIELTVNIPDPSQKTVFVYDGVDPALNTNIILYHENDELIFEYWDGSALRTESVTCVIAANTWTLVRLSRRDDTSLYFQAGVWGDDNFYITEREAISSGSNIGGRPSGAVYVGAETTNSLVSYNNPFYFENFRITYGRSRYKNDSLMPSADSYTYHGIIQSNADVLTWNDTTGAFEAAVNYGRAIVSDLAPVETSDGYPLLEGMTWYNPLDGSFYCRSDDQWVQTGGSGSGGALYLDDLINVDTGTTSEATLIFHFDEADGSTSTVDSVNGVTMSADVGSPEIVETGNVSNPSDGSLSVGTISTVPSSATDGSYSSIPTTGGSGTGMLANVTVTNGGASIGDYRVRANSGGINYQAGDSITILNADLVTAGINPGDSSDIVFSIDAVLESKFGSARLSFPTANDSTEISNADTQSYLDVGAMDAFTAEAWIYVVSGGSTSWFMELGQTSNSNPSVRGQFGFGADLNSGTGKTMKYKWRAGSGVYGTVSLPIPGGEVERNTWVHVAAVRDRGNVELFYNGLSCGVDDSIGTNDLESVTVEKGHFGYGMRGYMDDFRFTPAALYAGDFTPPSTSFSNGPINGASLVWDASTRTWVPGASSSGSTLDGLLDVSVPSPAVGDVLSYDGAEWVNTAAPPADISGNSINDLSDVNTASPAPSNGQTLVWDSATSKWVAGAATGGGLTEVVDDLTPQLGGDLDVNGKYITSAGGGNVEISPDGGGSFVVRGNSTDGAITLNCSANTHGVRIVSPPHADAADYSLILPSSAGTPGQVLTSQGGSQLTWEDAASGGGGVEEAPQDGQQYARQNAAWTVVQATSGVGAAGSYLSETQTASAGAATFTGLGHSGILQKVTSSLDAWIVVYGSAADMSADAARAYNTDPAISSGVMAEFYISAGGTVLATPGTSYFNNDSPSQDAIYVAVRDQAGANVDSQVTISAYGQVTIDSVVGGTFGSG